MRPLRAFANVFRAGLGWVLSALRWLVSRPKAGVNWIRQLRVEIWYVEGEERSSGLPLSILCAAHDVDSIYLLRLIFSGAYRQRRLGRFWLWSLSKAIAAAPSGCSLIVTQVYESKLRFMRCGDCFYVPTWVLGEVDLPRDAAASHKVNGDLRRIRRHGFEYEVTRDPAKVDDFYYHMHLPYVTQTFGDLAGECSYQRIRQFIEFSDLLLVKSGERSVAGQLVMHYKAGPFLGDIGIRDGNREYVKDGAGCALYHFCLQYLQEKGYKKAWLGWSRPFLRDGVLQYKRKWSQRITDTLLEGFALGILAHTPATDAFLRNNPFIFKRGGAFYGAVFVDGESPLSAEDVQQIDRDFYHPGMLRLRIYPLHRERVCLPGSIPLELAERIEVCWADELPPGPSRTGRPSGGNRAATSLDEAAVVGPS